MQIRSLRLDRFGACSDLSLDSLTDGVNVIHGPAGSGKATLIRLVRSVLYGFDDSTRRHYLPVDSRGYGGALTVRNETGLQTISRHDDGSPAGRLTIEHEDGAVVGRRHIPEAVTGIPESTFDRIYVVDYRRRPGIGALLEEAHANGLDLLGRTIETERVAALERQLREHRDMLATIARVGATHDELAARRTDLLTVIADLERALSHDEDEPTLTAHIARLESQLDERHVQLRKIQAELDQAERHHRELLTRRDQKPAARPAIAAQTAELQELTAQLQRWQTVLREIISRRQVIEQTAEKLSTRELNGEPRRCLGEVESQLDDLQTTLAGIDDVATYRGHEIRGLFAEVFSELRANVYRLCNELSYWEAASRHKDCTIETQHLSRSEAELRLAIKGLVTKKEALQSEIAAEMGDGGVSLVPWHESFCECAEHPTLRVPVSTETPTHDMERELTECSSLIASLERQQDRLIADLDDIEAELADVRGQLQRLNHVERLELLDSKRAELRRVEQDLRDIDRRRELLAEVARLEEEIAELRSRTKASTIVADASEYMRRLTGGDLHKIEVAANEQVWVIDEHGRRRAYHQLNDGGRDLVYLSICLALVECFQARGIRVPMIVSGVFTHVDSKNVPEAAELLRDFAARGHQILMFTRHEHVASVFRLLNVPVRTLPRLATANLRPTPAPAVSLPISGEASPQAGLVKGAWDAQTASLFGDQPDAAPTYTLTEHSPIEDVVAIDAASAERLRKIGVMRVGDLLRLSPKLAANDLGEVGISAELITTWQAQARLLCQVPRLRSYDARILVACGITEPEQLYRLSPRELREMVKSVVASSNGQAVLMSGTEFELSRVADWIRTDRDRNENSRERSPAPHHDRTSRSRAASGPRGHEPNVVRLRTADADRRFYLSRNDAVVDAPSIGPRTAERLEAIGIKSVAEFLQADPDVIARRLDVKRFTPQTVKEWQQQTELACRVPQLRGHDAQILVAVGVTDPERLAASDPQQLWGRVRPFVETKEGKRIIRNGKSPDLAEVTDWIKCAQTARQLHAA